MGGWGRLRKVKDGLVKETTMQYNVLQHTPDPMKHRSVGTCSV